MIPNTMAARRGNHKEIVCSAEIREETIRLGFPPDNFFFKEYL
jgi:hypothetical protein